MVDKNAIIADLEEHKLTHDEIAKKHGCHVRTVSRFVQGSGLYRGQGVKNWWEFTQSSQELAHLIGVYLTDGWISDIKGFSHSSVSIEYVAKTEGCLDACGVKRGKRGIKHPKDSNHQIQYVATSYSVMFSRWLNIECAGKSQIPAFLWDAPLDHKVAFLSAAIDGDGHVTLSGTIQLRGKDHWLFDLEKMLPTMGVRSNGVQVNEILPSGTPYYRININRIDFRALNPQLSIPEKQSRLLNAKEVRRNRAKKLYPCPLCGSVSMAKKGGKYCRACYLKSDDFHDHLVNIASKGGEAGNKIRWNR